MVTYEALLAAWKARDLVSIERWLEELTSEQRLVLSCWAAFAAETNLLAKILELGVDLNQAHRSHGRPLNRAFGRGPGIVRMLLEAGADPNQGVPLVMAALAGDLDAVKLLIEAGADIHQHHPGHPNALQGARLKGHDEVAEYLEALMQGQADLEGDPAG